MRALSSKGARRVLVYFMTNPTRIHHLRELASILSMDPGNLSREMRRLEEMGLFKTTERGRLSLFSLNTSHPLFKETKGLILKTEGAPTLIREALKKLKKIRRAFLYGSFASGSPDAESDIDLMVIGKVSTVELARALRPLEKRLGREISYRVVDPAEFANRLKKKDPFLTNVVRGKTLTLIEST